MIKISSKHVKYARNRWESYERKYIEAFSTGSITPEILGSLAKRWEGGFSISRRFQGGLKKWSAPLNRFYNNHVIAAIKHYRQEPDPQIVFSLHQRLAEKGPMEKKKRPGVLGISAASKVLFFMCPELPFFIYDSVARLALDIRELEPHEYEISWNRCREVQGRTKLPRGQLPEGVDKDWFHRRRLDKALYEKGEEQRRHLDRQARLRKARLRRWKA